jgi:hypothetical protein
MQDKRHAAWTLTVKQPVAIDTPGGKRNLKMKIKAHSANYFQTRHNKNIKL